MAACESTEETLGHQQRQSNVARKLLSEQRMSRWFTPADAVMQVLPEEVPDWLQAADLNNPTIRHWVLGAAAHSAMRDQIRDSIKDGSLTPLDGLTLRPKRAPDKVQAPKVALTGDALKASQAEAREARQDARLAHCEACGIVFDKVPGGNQLPYGIAKAAAKLDPPISRQSLATDVKAALKRRFAKAASGKG